MGFQTKCEANFLPKSKYLWIEQMLTSVHITQHKFVSDVQLLYGCPSICLQDKNVTNVYSRYIKRATVVCKYISIIKMLVSVFVLLEFYKSIWPAPGVPTITYSISQECTRWVSLQNHTPLTRRPKRTPSSSVCLTSSLWLRCLSVLVERERGF